MLSLFLAAALSASPAAVQLAAPVITGPNISVEEQTFYTDHLAQQLGFRGVRVTTQSEIQQLLGFERQKQLLGCSDTSSSCMAELANALGVDGIVTGSIGKIGKLFAINLKVIAAENGAPLAAYSSRAKDEEGVLDELTKAADSMSKELFKKLGREPVKSEPVEPKKDLVANNDVPKDEPATGVSTSTGGGLRTYAWAPAGAGVILAGLGTFFLIQGNGGKDKIDQAPSPEEAKKAYDAATGQQHLGGALLGVGAAALLTGGAFYLFGGTGQPAVALIPGPQPSLSVAGSFDLVGGGR
ncbi:MAG: hypothetical protein ACJ790_04110 [Myxococcaceae bacterium]